MKINQWFNISIEYLFFPSWNWEGQKNRLKPTGGYALIFEAQGWWDSDCCCPHLSIQHHPTMTNREINEQWDLHILYCNQVWPLWSKWAISHLGVITIQSMRFKRIKFFGARSVFTFDAILIAWKVFSPWKEWKMLISQLLTSATRRCQLRNRCWVRRLRDGVPYQ